jgi:hypothetical protein
MYRKSIIAFCVLNFLVSPILAQSTEDKVTYVSTVDDLMMLKGIINLNGSLFIHSGYDITTNHLCLLESLEQIEGYLVVWKSPGIRSLKCLKNLNAINGKELHTGSPPNSVFIEDNINQNSDFGLCFIDTIDWSLLTSKHISINDNSIDCPSCNSECKTCWGAGPRLCQTCSNYKSGVTCVNKCPKGTILNNVTKICQEFQPYIGSLSFINVSQELINDDVHVTLDWSRILKLINDSSVNLNGVPIGYRLYLDNELVFERKYRDFDNDYKYDDPVHDGLTEETLFLLGRLILNTSQLYSINFQVLNTIGWSPMSPSINMTTMDGIPMPVQNLNVTFKDTNVTVSWLLPSTTNGKISGLNLNIFQENDTIWSRIHSVNLPDDAISHIISLENSVEYRVCITTLNRNWDSIPICDIFQVPIVTTTTTTSSPYTGPPTTVTDLMVNILNSTKVVVSWNSLSDDHQVTLSNTTYSRTHNMSETNMVFDNLKPFTFYTIEVVAFDKFGYSPMVSTNWTTPYSNPPVPDGPYMYKEKLDDIWIWLKPVSDEFGYVNNYTLHVNATCNDDESYSLHRLVTITSLKLSDYMDIHDDNVYTFRLEAHVNEMSSISAYSDNMTTLKTYEDTGFSTWPVWLIIVVSLTIIFFIITIVLLIVFIRRRNRKKATHPTNEFPNEVRHYNNPVYDSKESITLYTNPTYDTTTTINGSLSSDEYGFGDRYDSLPYIPGQNAWDQSLTDDNYAFINDGVNGMFPKNMMGDSHL